MRIGVLIGGGERAVRAAHSLAADPSVEDVVVVGPAKSRNFRVVKDVAGLDLLVGSGPEAPKVARRLGVGLLWDGDRYDEGVAVWGASVLGLTTAMASQQRKPSLAALAHPNLPQASGRSIRFPNPVGATQTDIVSNNGFVVSAGKSYNQYAACRVDTRKRSITVVDRADFLSGVALAAGASVVGDSPRPVWDSPGPYLEMATGMGLVMSNG